MTHHLPDTAPLVDRFVCGHLLYAGGTQLSLTSAHYDLIPDLDALLARVLDRHAAAIQTVECRGVRNVLTDALVARIARLPRVTAVEFSNQEVTDAHARLLAAMPNLVRLTVVRSPRLTPAGVRVLAESGIVRVDLVGCPGVGANVAGGWRRG